MKFFTKSLLGAGAAAAALVTVAAPAQAQYRYDRYDRYDRNRDGISAGEIIAGAVILGGIAAVIGSGNNGRYNDGRYNNDRNYNRGYNNDNGSRTAVNQCISTVENWANGYSRSNVTQITSLERTYNGYRVSGKLVVEEGYRGNNNGYGNGSYGRDDRYDRNDRYDRDDRYDRNNGYGNDRYGNSQGYNRGYDKGRFTCYVERGRVIDVNYRGLDQWR